ncbi:PaaI family thioesterase [uncultured Veillonella sp.]|uniref:PaaI family thioesterase n=1 Tax=uncultured Veillonella sp. TaxID=159268 RepID=UPI00263263FA|nr:PaaI family thioesterase [uncultured Veillonella sp.]
MEQNIRTLVDYFNSIRESNTFEWSKDYVVTSGKPGHLEMTFTTDVIRHMNFHGAVQGGVYMTFSDILMGVSCFTLGRQVVTMEIKGNFIKSCRAGEVLRGVGNVEHNGKNTLVATSRIYDSVGELVYMGTGTFYAIGEHKLPDLPWHL